MIPPVLMISSELRNLLLLLPLQWHHDSYHPH